MKKIVILLITVFVVTVSCISLTACNGHDAEVWLKDVDISATLNESGDLIVEERWKVHFDTGKKNAYKTFQLRDSDFGHISELKDVSVYDMDRDMYFKEITLPDSPERYVQYTTNYDTFYIYGQSSQKELGLVVYPEEGERNFVWKYAVTDMAAKYADTSVVYWKIFNTDFAADIENFRLELTLPTGTTNDAQGWFHIETSGAYLTLEADKFVYTAKNIKAGTMVETRVVAPTDTFGELAKHTGSVGLESIRAEELKWAEEWQSKQRLYRTLAVLAVVVNVIIAAAGIAVAVLVKIKNRPYNEDYPEYERELPQGWAVAEAAHLFYYYSGGFGAKDYRSRALSAVILDLTRRHYLEVEPVPNAKSGEEYRITFPQVADSMLKDLKPHERLVYNLLLKAKSNGNTLAGAADGVTMKEFQKYAKADYLEVNNLMKDFEKSSGQKFSRGKYAPPKTRFKEAGIGMLVAAIALLIVAFRFAMFFAPGLGVAGLALSLLAPKMKRLNKEGERIYRQLKGLEKYMLDFSNLKEYDVPKLILWEEYLVYATMMGISKEVIKNLKLVYPELRDDFRGGMYGYNRGYLFTYLWLSSHTGSGLDFGTEMGRSIQQVATVARTLSTPKSSGSGSRFGGFGGGGGGFGGGGGGFGGGGGGFR